VRNKALETPLHLAAYGGHLGIVEFLLDHGAEVNGTTDAEDTALFYASRRGHAPVIRQLLQRGADAALRNRFGDCAVDEAKGDRARAAFSAEKIDDRSFGCLKSEVLRHALAFCAPRELSRAACACGRWQRAAEDPKLWEALGVKRWELSLQFQFSGFRPAVMSSFRPRSSGAESRRPPSGRRSHTAKDGSTSGETRGGTSRPARRGLVVETGGALSGLRARPSSGGSSPSCREQRVRAARAGVQERGRRGGRRPASADVAGFGTGLLGSQHGLGAGLWESAPRPTSGDSSHGRRRKGRSNIVMSAGPSSPMLF
jgi:hypothetical protein